MAKADGSLPHQTQRDDLTRRGGIARRLLRKGAAVFNNLGLIVSDPEGNRRVAVGDIGGHPWGLSRLIPGTYGFWGDQAGLYLRGYPRLLRWGHADDEEIIDLSNEPNLANPQILVAPKDFLTIAPQPPNIVSHTYTDVIEIDTHVYKIQAKAAIRGGFVQWPGGWTSGGPRAGAWEQPQTAGPDGRRGVPTNFIQCRVFWFASSTYVIHVNQYVTNEFDSNGQPTNWKHRRHFQHQGPLLGSHSGTLNWDLSLEDDVWAVRVTWDGGNPPLATYATAEVRGSPSPGYRTDVYYHIDGTVIQPNQSSGMSVMYIAYDIG